MGGSWVVRRTSQKAVMMDRCISAPADSLSVSGCMTARVLFLVRAWRAAAEATMRSRCAIARRRQGPIRPDVIAIKLSAAFGNLNASKLFERRGLAVTGLSAQLSTPSVTLPGQRPPLTSAQIGRSPGNHFGLGRRGSGQNDVLARARPPPIPAATPSARQHPAPVIVPSGAKAMAHMPPAT
jgi:hypothetical protein